MKCFVRTESVSKAEVLWCLQTVMGHTSLRNAANSASVFQVMFPDSAVARGMQMKSKISSFVVGFDESLNKIAQKQQMDVSLRFWNKETNQVGSRYITSVFLKHTTANDLLTGLKAGLDKLNLACILQLPMDDPNVNLKLQEGSCKRLKTRR
ncbi:hypothetical protein PR048_003749 [Dryococelus australis]|uniref:Uncharacterized protein n=1 Tax=Dryococelus australis TaxID=614101 RepID=A0ABQ9IQ29_9NEOP|nr:hypothetical protein PR048_003749 [Dryococelus australis]